MATYLDPALEASRSPRASEFIPLIDPSQIPSFASWLSPQRQAYYDARGTGGLPFHALTPELRAMAERAGVRPSGDNSPEYDYLTQFYQLPAGHNDWLEMGGPALAGAFFGGAAGGLFSGAGGTGTAISGSAPLAGAVSAPAGSVAAADVAGLVQMGQAAGLSGSALDAFVASGGTLGSTAAGAGVLSGTISNGIGGATTSQLSAPSSGNTGSIFGIPNNVLSGILQGGLGYLGAGQVADAYRDVANQNLALGAPYRNILQQSYAPGFDLMSQPGYGDALNRMADISARSYSAKFGNPGDSPTAQAGILGDVWNQSYLPALSNYRGQLGQFGGLGLSTAGAAQLGGAANAGQGLNAIGYGIGTVLNPTPTLEDTLRTMQRYGATPNYSLNIGGTRY